MAVTFDAGTLKTQTTSASSWTWTHTVGAGVTNGVLLVWVWNSGTGVNTVTWGATSLTKVLGALTGNFTGLTAYAIPTGSTTGAQTITVTNAAATTGIGFSESFAGSVQSYTWTFGTNWNDSGGITGSGGSVTLAVPTNGRIASGTYWESTGTLGGSPTSTSGTVETSASNVAINGGHFGYGVLDGTVTPVTWNDTGAANGRIASIALSAAATSTNFTQSVVGTLSFTGAQTNLTTKRFPGTLSFAGGYSKQTGKTTTAALSLAGSVTRVPGKAMTASLSYAGSVRRAISYVLTAGLTSTGNLTRGLSRRVSASLSFGGNLAIARLRVLALSGALSVSGATARSVGKALTASQIFAGTVGKRLTRGLKAALGFAGGLVSSHTIAGPQISGEVALMDVLVNNTTLSDRDLYLTALAEAPLYGTGASDTDTE